ncbi:MAG: ABC transporter permease [Planctomycetaceae bacterium]|nr:ABC transporter permease [Planctomycetaceae bacterium]
MNCNTSAVFAIFKKDLREKWFIYLIQLFPLLVFILFHYVRYVFDSAENPIVSEARINNLLYSSIFFAMGFNAICAVMVPPMMWAMEHENKTFHFLRQLPVSAKDIALGKSLAVLFCIIAGAVLYLAIAVGFGFLLFGRFAELPTSVWITYAVLLLHAAVWGMFWSPRCKSNFLAGLMSGLCSVLLPVLYVVLCVWGFWLEVNPSDMSEVLFLSVPLSVLVIVIITPFAVKGMLRWLEPEKPKIQKQSETEVQSDTPFIVRPALTSPFAALLHQTYNQSKGIYFTGIICVAVMYMLFVCAMICDYTASAFILTMLFVSMFVLPFVFGATFCKDQSNKSYNFLTRCGAVPGQVWWSRMLPMFGIAAALLFFPIYDFIRLGHIGLFFLELAMLLLPLSVGSLISLCDFNGKFGAAASAVGYGWTMNAGFVSMLFIGIFGLYFTPVLVLFSIVMLITSRHIAEYWLREQVNNRTVNFALIPFWLVFGAVLIAAIPALIASGGSIADPFTMIRDAYF